MVFTNSPLVDYTRISPYHSGVRTSPIKKITIHHMAGNLSIEVCGEVFQSRKASSNYGVGSDGRVGMYLYEKYVSWASCSYWNDNQSATIEVANNKCGGNWSISAKAMKSLIELCVDICKRNGIPKLEYTGDANGTLTIHSMFAATACPGPYLKSKLNYICKEVNKKLNKPTTYKINTVARVQTWLNETYNSGLNVDNDYGKLTHKALVKALQVCLGVNPDGDYGPITNGAVKTLQKGSKGALVEVLQAMLVCRGYGKYTWVTGNFGSGTAKAVGIFQKDVKLKVTKRAGKQTHSRAFKNV